MNYLKIAEGIDVEQINKELRENPQVWNSVKDRTEQETSPHREVSDIWVRYSDIEEFRSGERGVPFISHWYKSAECLPSIVDFSFRTMFAVEGENLGAVLVTKVPAGGKVYPHTDTGWHVDFYDKFYLHLESNDNVEFCWKDGQRIQPKKGDLYWLDNTKEHWVNNDGETDRTTLIVCIKPFIRMKDKVGQ